jgi:ribosomal protein S18 acetylase RimI-like enzyme
VSDGPVSSPLVIRAAVPADRDALVELDIASAVHHAALDPDSYRVPDREAVASFLDRRGADPDREVLVAVVDEAVVGMVDVTILESPDNGSIVRPIPTADIGISVLEAWRGRGIGRQLMEAADASARARGAQQIVLDMSSSNVGALRFYRRLGYVDSSLVLRRSLR